jgi:hypothetical protein
VAEAADGVPSKYCINVTEAADGVPNGEAAAAQVTFELGCETAITGLGAYNTVLSPVHGVIKADAACEARIRCITCWKRGLGFNSRGLHKERRNLPPTRKEACAPVSPELLVKKVPGALEDLPGAASSASDETQSDAFESLFCMNDCS